MKKHFLLLVFTAIAIQLKAQSLTLPSNTLAVDKLNNVLKFNSDTGLFKYLPALPKVEPAATVMIGNNGNVIEGSRFSSRMPVAKLYSTDNMPIAKTDRLGVHYLMLIKKIAVESDEAKEASATP